MGIQRQSPKRLIVTTPEPRIIFHSTAESTFIETLSWIGGARVAKVGLKISNMPLVTRRPYACFAKYMKPIGDGWYVNMIGTTSDKFLKLCAINNNLQLGMKIETVDDSPFIRSKDNIEFLEKEVPQLDLGKKKSRSTDNTLCVTYNGCTYDFNNRYGKTQFASVIEAIGAESVWHLGLKMGQKDLITVLRINDRQYPCSSYWVNSPTSAKQKRKILLVIKAMLHLDMAIDFFPPLKTSQTVYENVFWNYSQPPKRLPPVKSEIHKPLHKKNVLPPNPVLKEKSHLAVGNITRKQKPNSGKQIAKEMTLPTMVHKTKMRVKKKINDGFSNIEIIEELEPTVHEYPYKHPRTVSA